jgi:hypothetical protein
MERCPACNAPLKGQWICRRCRADLTPLLNVAEDVKRHVSAAREAFRNRDGHAMLHHAKHAFSKRRTPATGRLLAVAAVLAGEFDLAQILWRLCRDESFGEQ